MNCGTASTPDRVASLVLNGTIVHMLHLPPYSPTARAYRPSRAGVGVPFAYSVIEASLPHMTSAAAQSALAP